MVPDAARVKLSERIQMAQRLGGEFYAESLGMIDALNGFVSLASRYNKAGDRDSYERGYRDAKQIIEVETVLAARVVSTHAEGAVR